MSLYAGLALGLIGVVCILAGAQNRGVQLSRTVFGTSAAGSAPAGGQGAVYTPPAPSPSGASGASSTTTMAA